MSKDAGLSSRNGVVKDLRYGDPCPRCNAASGIDCCPICDGKCPIDCDVLPANYYEPRTANG